MNVTIKLALGVLFGSAFLGGLPSTASAQDDILTQIVPSLEFQEADVREALRSLFRSKNVSYSIAPDVQGTVNVSLKNVTFEVALQNITRQVDATYRIEGGVFNIIRREVTTSDVPTGLDPATVAPTSTKVVRRIKIRAADPQFIAMMIGQANGSQQYILPPEISTLSGGGMGGMGGGMGGMGGGGFGGGMGGMGGGGFGGGGFGGGGFGGGGFGGGMGGGGFGGGMGGGGFGGRGGGGFGGGGFGGGRGGF
jgi:hypothetical protein